MPHIQGALLVWLHSTILKLRGCHPLWRGFSADLESDNGYSAPHLLNITVQHSVRSVRR